MFEEREIQPGDLLNTLLQLDFDEGIRIHDGAGCFSFVTRSAVEYTMNICRGSGEKWEYAKTAEEAYKILQTYIKEPFKAWLY